MFYEERVEDQFSTYRNREEFIRELLDVVDNKITDEEMEDIYQLLDIPRN
ncbi:hypothetical protein mru_2072 [Methanobrevibacter ruminantium M1]|uniref:Uncharacterized protein n=1 Tax=Methanobrevibacter ruminantium (strain ATCC 35063 / DSM 1093 / JCM 13430 / OCM 146 / M1) TaxID=634498 RepID=D3E0U8_METRM|nr:hypothetical protein [Methanobrevibacter ruminantium]ADC47922.1 hypothetical protein mru_2072 [Methanobrevibacter ruminantium M1]